MEERKPTRRKKSKASPKKAQGSPIIVGLVAVIAGAVLIAAVISIVSRSVPQQVADTPAPNQTPVPPHAGNMASPAVPAQPTPASRPTPTPAKPEPMPVNVSTKGGLPKGYDRVVAVMLDPKTFEGQAVDSVLLRELVCQAVLITAEDELGLATLDPAIGEVIPESEDMAGPVTVKGMAMHYGKIGADGKQIDTLEYTISLQRPGGTRVTRSQIKLVLPPNDWTDSAIEQIEGLSRGKFVDFLLNAGFKKEEAKSSEIAPSLNGLQDRLDFISQFAWIQHLRAKIRAEGESLETLSGLVRAYANLGNLTDFHWNAASKAFKTRALLYAQRMLAKYGESPITLAHRAYANALSGRHATAIAAIEAAHSAKGTAAPAWLRIVDAYVAYRPNALKEVTGSEEELALYLRTRMLDLDLNPEFALEEILNFLDKNPACCRATELIAEVPRLGSRRAVTEGGFDARWPNIYGRLTEVPNLPPAAKEIAIAESQKRDGNTDAEHERRRELMNGLASATTIKETQGPSWMVLADMLREVTFTQVWRKLDFERHNLGVNCDDTLQHVRPLIQGHRFEKVLDTYGSKYDAAAISDYHRWLNSRYTSVSALPIYKHMKKIIGEDKGVGVGSTILESCDNLYEEQVRRLAWTHGLAATQMYVLSPFWPGSIADTILHDWKLASSRAAEWEEAYSDSTPVLMAFARQYQLLKRRSDAIRCLNKANQKTPTFAAYLTLATLYDELDDVDKWQKALQAATKLPELGLEKSQAEAALAEGFMKRGEWKKAKPYALSAANSGAAWAMQTAARVSEGLGDWKAAEGYVSAISQHYEPDADLWYFWCVRTGRGNARAAKTLAENYWRTKGAMPSEDLKYHLAMGQMFDGRTAEAVATLRDFYLNGNRHHEEYGTLAAVLADSIGDNKTRDELFTQMFAKWEQYKPYHELINLFRGVISGDENKRWDPLAFEVIVLNTDASTVPWLYMLAGIFLANHQTPELSQQYLQTAATAFDVSRTSCVIATHMLRKQKVAIGKTRMSDLPDSLVTLAESLRKAQIARDDQQPNEADAILMKALEQRADFIPASLILAKSYTDQGRFTDAITQYEGVLKIDPNLSAACNRLSMIYSTCPEDAIRSGKKAMEYAERGNSVRALQDAETLSALAAANAELGEFDKAIELQTRACTMELYRSLKQLESYQQKKPFRQLRTELSP